MARASLAAVALAAVAATVAGVVAGAGTSAAGSQGLHGGVVPHAQARLIAAEFKGSHSYLPRRVPDGFAFTRWTIDFDCGSCMRLVVRFRRRTSVLKWEAFLSRNYRRPWLNCRRQNAPYVGRIDGRRVLYRRGRRTETAWICLSDHWREVVSVTHRLGRADGVSAKDLERMVASARAQPPGRAPRGHYELPSRRTVRRVVAKFGSPLFVPRRMAGGFVFTRWSLRPHEFGQRVLYLTFARDGVATEWEVAAGHESGGDWDCPRNGSPQRDYHRRFRIDGKRVYYSFGVKGSVVWRCVRPHAIGNKRALEVTFWFDGQLDTRAFRRRAARIVATARVVHEERAAQAASTRIVYGYSTEDDAEIHTVNPNGARDRAVTSTRHIDLDPTWSPRRRRIAFTRNGKLFVMRANGKGVRRLTRVRAQSPAWSPDGKRIAFSGRRKGASAVFVIRPSGRGLRRLTRFIPGYRFRVFGLNPDWSPSGRSIVYDGEKGIVRMRANGRRKRLIVRDGADANWSRDGKRLAFVRSERIFVARPDGSKAHVVTACGANECGDSGPAWSPSGRRIAYAHLGDLEGSDGGIWTIRPDGSGDRQIAVDGSAPDW